MKKSILTVFLCSLLVLASFANSYSIGNYVVDQDDLGLVDNDMKGINYCWALWGGRVAGVAAVGGLFYGGYYLATEAYTEDSDKAIENSLEKEDNLDFSSFDK